MEEVARINKKIYIIFVALAIIIGAGAYFIGLTQGKSTIQTADSSQTQSAALPPDFQKALLAKNAYPKLITYTTVSQVYSGTLTDVIDGQSWTLEKNGKKVTIANSGVQKINYFTYSKAPAAIPSPIPDLKLKKGDQVIINLSYIANDTKTSVWAITLVSPDPTPTSK